MGYTGTALRYRKVAWLSQRLHKGATIENCDAIMTLICRVTVCLGMSAAGLSNRIEYASSRWFLLRDMLSICLENHLLLILLEQVLDCHSGSGHSKSTRHQPTVACNKTSQLLISGCYCCCCCYCTGIQQKQKQQRWHVTYRLLIGRIRIKQILRILIVGLLCFLWILAGWGDLVFQKETQGLLPTLWVVAPGLKDPFLHAGVQLKNHYDIFVGGLIKSCFGLVTAIMFIAVLRYFCQWSKRSNLCFRVGNCSRKFRQAHVVSCNVIFLTVLFCFGAWAPLTNLLFCIFGVLMLTPPGGSSIETNAFIRRRGTSGNSTATQNRRTMPNVILVVHESLSGAAIESVRGRHAAPFYHSLKTNPNMYHFQSARTVSGVTTIATPGLLTGLAPYTDEGVKLIKSASLASSFKAMGYDTASFVSYGADWTGNTWDILTDLLIPGFDIVVDPKATGDPLVNEYGMDDRKLTGTYFRRWLEAKGGKAYASFNSTNATARAPHSNMANKKSRVIIPKLPVKPFFAVVVMNNNHFPHLQHETYIGNPECAENFAKLTYIEGSSNISANQEEAQSQPGSDDYFGNWNMIAGCGFDVESRYFSSIRSTDESLENMFKALEEAGELNNTIIMGAGDHGDVPGLMRRMEDVNAPILNIPLWMHLPAHLLPSRAFMDKNGKNSSIFQSERRGMPWTYLNANINRTVSILDIIPTLREALDLELYTPEQVKECITGRSLLSDLVPEDRILPSWQGRPMQVHQIGIFSTKDEALLYYQKDPSKSRVVNFAYYEDNPLFGANENKLVDNPELQSRWQTMLKKQGYLEHPSVQKWMNDLPHILGD